jgi:F-type H+-transporting ATPase subunit b
MLHDPKTLLALSIIVFVVLLFKPIRKLLLGALDNRIETIKSRFDEARQLREEAQATLASYKRKQRLIQEEAEKILKTAREEGENLKTFAINAVKADIERKRLATLEKIKLAEKTAQAEVQHRVIALTIKATRTIIEETYSEKQFENNFDKNLELLASKLR